MEVSVLVDRERLEEFRARFGVSSDPALFERFKTRIVRAAKESFAPLLDKDRQALESEFAFRNGSQFIMGDLIGYAPWVQHGVADELEDAETSAELIERIQHVLWSLESLGHLEQRQRYSQRDGAGLIFAQMVHQAIELSPGIDVRAHAEPGRVELVPAGVPLLDDLVDRATQWLAQYPDVQKEFRQAQTILAEKKRDQYRQAQDCLRFALEKLLKLLLKNNDRLEEQGKALKAWLTSKNVHEALRNVAVQILGIVTTQYQNAAVKHDNIVAGGAEKTWSDFEVEFVLYQYATLTRLLIEASEPQA